MTFDLEIWLNRYKKKDMRNNVIHRQNRVQKLEFEFSQKRSLTREFLKNGHGSASKESNNKQIKKTKTYQLS